MNTINIPVGTSNFAEIRRKGSYFIDKSSLIEQLLKTQSTKVTLITRPHRFGKTLGMSMLSEFFDIQKNSRALFEGLSVMKNKELCRQWMNQYPTL
ncbi:MAG: AAA family ATPase, partial [Eubacterium sp.]|nr:AAA family ATPase [Eubacterium sp.]